MAQDNLPGLEKFNGIKVKENGEKRKVFVDGHCYFSWNSSDEIGQRTAIVQLCELGLGTQEEVANAFGIHINSVYKNGKKVTR